MNNSLISRTAAQIVVNQMQHAVAAIGDSTQQLVTAYEQAQSAQDAAAAAEYWASIDQAMAFHTNECDCVDCMRAYFREQERQEWEAYSEF